MQTQPAGMLARLAGNHALKQDLSAALRSGRLPHSILLVGEPGCGAGFAARCLAADYLYPAGGPHAEAVLRGEDAESITVRGEGVSGQIKVERIRDARDRIQRSANTRSSVAAGRVLFIYGAQALNGSSANAMLKIMEEPPEGVLFLLTSFQRGRRAAHHPQPLRGLHRHARPRRMNARPNCAAASRGLTSGRPTTSPFCMRGASARRWTFCATLKPRLPAPPRGSFARQAQARDTYRAAALLANYERDREGALRLLGQATQAASAALRRPRF